VSATEPQRFARCTLGDVSRIAPAAALATVALVVAQAADAKGPDRAVVCGADRCASLRGPAVAGLLDWGGQAGFEQLPAPRRVPFYRLTLFDHGRPAWKLVYAPSLGRVRITQLDIYPFGSTAPYWRAVTSVGTSALARATRGLAPFPAPKSWH
jgi:hypothetical protein